MPPELHSFPTRRSSDLMLLCVAGENGRPQRGHPGEQGDVSSSMVARSEEHTSELQSLAYLVCRLLLEKKKPVTDDAVVGTLEDRRLLILVDRDNRLRGA